jgi:sensor histidine kinase YesM
MPFLSRKFNLIHFQWLVVIFVFLVVMLSLLPMDGFAQALVYALLNTSFYTAIVYGNILWLLPRLYEQGKTVLYFLAVIAFLVTIGSLRAFITLTVYNSWFAKHPEVLTFKAISSMIIGGVMIFLLSFVFRMAIQYFRMKQRADEILAQKTQAELNLLKSQVQPHFLFNTLNNIYYEAYLEAPRTADLIERLSEIMRYFVDESPKERVSLPIEIEFLENYIALEKIRIRYEIDLTFTLGTAEKGVTLPPMLLITFVENIFKHGIDKTSSHNQIRISLSCSDDQLMFTTSNTLPNIALATTTSKGFGLDNLRKRLVLLYGKDFELQTGHGDKLYKASLKIPLT